MAFECPLCLYVTDIRKQYDVHRKIFHDLHNCRYCGIEFSGSDNLQSHIHNHCPYSPHKSSTSLVGSTKLTSSKCPQYHLIPTSGLNCEASRFELGEIKHKDKTWNAKYPEKLTEEFVIERLNHVIKHAKLALDIIIGVVEDDGDDNASAIKFGGSVLAEWNRISGSRNSSREGIGDRNFGDAPNTEKGKIQDP